MFPDESVLIALGNTLVQDPIKFLAHWKVPAELYLISVPAVLDPDGPAINKSLDEFIVETYPVSG